jgi:hypothetical protein
MFPYADPSATLDLHRQKVDQMIREATEYRLARTASAGRHRRFGRWRSGSRGRGERVAAAA